MKTALISGTVATRTAGQWKMFQVNRSFPGYRTLTLTLDSVDSDLITTINGQDVSLPAAEFAGLTVNVRLPEDAYDEFIAATEDETSPSLAYSISLEVPTHIVLSEINPGEKGLRASALFTSGAFVGISTPVSNSSYNSVEEALAAIRGSKVISKQEGAQARSMNRVRGYAMETVVA
jgi:hypothetical protein